MTMRRTHIIKFRVSAEEKRAIEEKALAAGLSVSDCIRRSLGGKQARFTPEEKERLRQLARIGNNLNQIARWANTHKASLEAVDVLLAVEAAWKGITGQEDACT